jgi:hypothetical protein
VSTGIASGVQLYWTQRAMKPRKHRWGPSGESGIAPE